MYYNSRSQLMSILDLMKERYSARSYSEKAIDKETMDYILEAGRVAPTAANRQTHRILVINSKEGIEKLNKSCRTHNPTTVLIVCSDPANTWINPYDDHDMNDIDCSIVSTHMMLAAKEKGVDSVWLNWFEPEVIYKEFNIPREYKIVNLLSLGYANSDAPSPNRHKDTRKPISDTVFYENF